MNCAVVSATLFARDHKSVAAFYCAVSAATVARDGAHHAVLICAGFELVIHQIPPHLMPEVTTGEVVRRREQSAIRLDFPAGDIAQARRAAARLGGVIDEQPPPWAGGDIGFFLGHDPEGNVFGVKLTR